MAGKFYAVKKGKVPGIYTSWDACKSMVHGFPGAVYKGFATRAEAEQFLEEKKEEQKEPENYAFVDGSFNSATSVYGYGGFLVTKGERHVISGSGNDRSTDGIDAQCGRRGVRQHGCSKRSCCHGTYRLNHLL